LNRGEIYINGRFLGRDRTGVERYSREVVAALDRLLDQEETQGLFARYQVKLLAPPGTECDLDLRQIHFACVGKFKGHLWEQVDLPRYAASGLLLSLANSAPIRHRKQVTVLHDAAIYRYPAGYTWQYRLFHKLLDSFLVRSAQIATVSEFSRAELAQVLSIPEEAVILAPNGTDHLQSVPQDHQIVDRLNLTPGKYFVTLGLSSTNKNIGMALKAFELLGRADTQLVVIGKAQARIAGTQELQASKNVILAGRLEDQEVRGLLAYAAALLFPSRYEGFGLPPLEAMSVGCPVLASTAGAVMEACGGAALHFHPDNAALLSDLMSRVIGEPELSRELRSRGLARLTHYHWDSTAETLLCALQKMTGGREGNKAASRRYASKTGLPTG
jgi:glycosyltransferase involved in cell wall biosynthesis